jgi:hypothetical protein
MNFARRTSCNRCQASKSAEGGGGGGEQQQQQKLERSDAWEGMGLEASQTATC